jgi:hypothetical protein
LARLNSCSSTDTHTALLQLFTAAPVAPTTAQQSDNCGRVQSDQTAQHEQQQLYIGMDVHTDGVTADNDSSHVVQTVHSRVERSTAQQPTVAAHVDSSDDSSRSSSDSDSDFEKPKAVAARKRQAAAAGQHQPASKRARSSSSIEKGSDTADDNCTVPRGKSARSSSSSSNSKRSSSSRKSSSSSSTPAASAAITNSTSGSVTALQQRGTALPFGNLDALALGPLACDAHVARIVAAACKHGGRHEPKSSAAAAASNSSSTSSSSATATAKKRSPAKGKGKSTRVQLVGNRLNCVVGVKSRFVGYGSGHTCSVEKLVLQVICYIVCNLLYSLIVMQC